MRNYIAEIDSDNKVLRVIVCDSVDWATKNLGGVWLPANGKIGKGFRYDPERDAFIPPKPFESWVLDEATCLWQAPIAYPADGGEYTWDESLGDWVEVVSETT